MLGFSIQKLLVLVGIIAAVWYGFKLVGRLDAARKMTARNKPRARDNKVSGAAPDDAARDVEEMERCDACGAYVAGGAGACGRDDCPYPG